MGLIQANEKRLWQLVRRDDYAEDDDGDDDDHSKTFASSSTTAFASSTTKIASTSSSSSANLRLSTSTIFTTTSTSTAFSTLPPSSTQQATSTQGQRGVASVAPLESLVSSTPSSAAAGISDTSSNGTGFYVGIGVAIGASVAIILSALCFLYRRRHRSLHSNSSSIQTHYHNHMHHYKGSEYGSHSIHSQPHPSPQYVDAGNNYNEMTYTPGPPVPGKSMNGNVTELEKGAFHPNGLGTHPVVHSPSSFIQSVSASHHRGSYLKEKVKTPMTVSTGILRTKTINKDTGDKGAGKIRATSAPVGADVLRYTRERGLEAEMGKQKMGEEWEIARKRGTGEPLGSEAGSEGSLPRWRDAVTWVRDQRARVLGRDRLS